MTGTAAREWTKVSAFIRKNWLMARRNIFTVFEVVFWPTVGIFSVGLLTRFVGLGPETTAFILIGTLALSIIQVCQLDVAYAILFEMWAKGIKHQFLAPVGLWHLALGSWLMGILRGLAVFALAAGLAWWGFGFDFFRPGPAALAAFLLGLFLNAVVIGLGVSTLLLLFGLRAEVSAWSAVSLILLLAGIYYPVSLLPAPVAAVAAGIPLTYFLDAFRAHYGFAPVFEAALVKGFATSLVYLALTYGALGAALTHARRRGTLLRLSE